MYSDMTQQPIAQYLGESLIICLLQMYYSFSFFSTLALKKKSKINN